ncbi:hypothetical protein DM587_17430 [Vibrio fluvialis]|nr:hypothetical protein DJ016_19005 [Vibrio fluvialis]TRN09722.1 hypothetical protein DM587_17430 [Vibrio fluvialis]
MLFLNKPSVLTQNKSLRNRFPHIAPQSEIRKMNRVGRMLTRNRKSLRIGDLQEEDTVIQDE